jgi:dTDP-4-dehydrorhamnose reductase
LKILLTGADGQVGRCMQELCTSLAHDLIALEHSSLDVTDADEVDRTIDDIRPDIIINAAAYTAVDKAESEPDIAQAVNVAGPANLANSAEVFGGLLIHISTDYVFDGRANKPYSEEDEAAPLGVYGRTKRDGEIAVAARCTRHIILRTGWIFSEHGNNFLKTMLRLGKDRSELSVVADQVGCPTYGGDVAKACVAIAEGVGRGHCNYGTYHFVGNVPVTWYVFAKAIFENAKRSGILEIQPTVKAITTEDYPTAAYRPAYSVLCTKKIREDYGVPACNWRSALQEVMAKLS